MQPQIYFFLLAISVRVLDSFKVPMPPERPQVPAPPEHPPRLHSFPPPTVKICPWPRLLRPRRIRHGLPSPWTLHGHPSSLHCPGGLPCLHPGPASRVPTPPPRWICYGVGQVRDIVRVLDSLFFYFPQSFLSFLIWFYFPIRVNLIDYSKHLF